MIEDALYQFAWERSFIVADARKKLDAAMADIHARLAPPPYYNALFQSTNGNYAQLMNSHNSLFYYSHMNMNSQLGTAGLLDALGGSYFGRFHL